MPKQIPMRTCVVCRGMFPKSDLIRIVRTPDGISIDTTGITSGRGAYICKNSVCIEKCVKKKMLDRAFNEKLSSETYETLKNEYSKLDEN